ncbi:cation:proton antiporter [Streptomyces sp. NPDC059002]|uniref:cation:proton antiporter domain-containing protein n=1 Tax=Streptomyces sp. NPDC059002 TaxID=3346690 RepID=UPI00368A179C
MALPFMTYAMSLLVGGNGFVAAFVAGWCYATTTHAVGHRNLELAHDAGEVMALAVWFLFGKLTADEFTADGLSWPVVGYALLALTVARIVPVYTSLTGLDFSRAERGAVGWRGAASRCASLPIPLSSPAGRHSRSSLPGPPDTNGAEAGGSSLTAHGCRGGGGVALEGVLGQPHSPHRNLPSPTPQGAVVGGT